MWLANTSYMYCTELQDQTKKAAFWLASQFLQATNQREEYKAMFMTSASDMQQSFIYNVINIKDNST